MRFGDVLEFAEDVYYLSLYLSPPQAKKNTKKKTQLNKIRLQLYKSLKCKLNSCKKKKV